MSKKPCRECPFRKKSAPGYLGESSYEPRKFLEQLESINPMPCHMSIDWEEREKDGIIDGDAVPCTGAMQFMNNSAKQSRYYPLLQKQYGKNEDVFTFNNTFIKHHGNKTN